MRRAEPVHLNSSIRLPSAAVVAGAIVTVGGNATPGPDCSATHVATRLQGLMAAFNAGDQTALAGFFDRNVIFGEPNPLMPAFFLNSASGQALVNAEVDLLQSIAAPLRATGP